MENKRSVKRILSNFVRRGVFIAIFLMGAVFNVEAQSVGSSSDTKQRDDSSNNAQHQVKKDVSHGQTVVIQGVVLAASNKESLPGVTIFITSNPQLSPSTSLLRAHVLSLLNYQIN
jgi:hypothetical protein